VDVRELTHPELLHIVWEQLGVRASHASTTNSLHDVLSYRLSVDDLPDNPINRMRDEMVNFITNNLNRLSLPCNGDCYSHNDGVVISCFKQYRKDNDDQ
jgi:hypothetical protein